MTAQDVTCWMAEIKSRTVVVLALRIIPGASVGSGRSSSPRAPLRRQMPRLPQTSQIQTLRHTWACVSSPPGTGACAGAPPHPGRGPAPHSFPSSSLPPRLPLHPPPTPAICLCCFSVCVSLCLSVSVSVSGSRWGRQTGSGGDWEAPTASREVWGQSRARQQAAWSTLCPWAAPGRTVSRWLVQRPEGDCVGPCSSCPGTPPS